MPRISTDNYDTVASWNGSQDLFIVEQPDGTKVATPAMVKQFIEAGDFTATGEIEDGHGNILADMAKADEVKGLAEAGDFEATGDVKDGNGNMLKDIEEKSGVIILNSGWNFDGGVVNTVRKVGNIAWLSSYIYNTNNLTANTVYEVGTMPAGFAPSKEFKFPIYQGADLGTVRGILNIKTDGKIMFRSVDGSRYAIYTTVMYPLS